MTAASRLLLAAAGILLAGTGFLLAGSAAAGAQAPTAPTRDQRALKVLAEARDLVAAGLPDESIPFYGHALDLAEAELDEPSVALANLLAEYGNVLRGAGYRNRERARVSLERSLEMLESLVDEGDARLATPLLGLGRLDADEERCAEARAHLERGIGLIDVEGQPGLAVSAQVALGRCAEVDERPDQNLDEAFDHYRSAVLTARAASLETPEVATALHLGATILLQRGESENAILFFRQCLRLRGRLLGEDHWRTAETATQLARALDEQGQRPEAREIANQAARSLGRTCAPSSQAPRKARDVCTEVSLLRRRLVGEPDPIAEMRPVLPAPQPPPRITAPPPAAEASGPAWRVQVSSQRSPAEAERVAERVRARFTDLLSAQRLTLERVDLASGTWHRVLFGSFVDRQEAVALCEALKQSGLDDCLPSLAE